MAAQRLSCCSAFRWAIRCLLGDHSIVVAFRRGHKVVWAIKTGSQQNGQNMGDEKKKRRWGKNNNWIAEDKERSRNGAVMLSFTPERCNFNIKKIGPWERDDLPSDIDGVAVPFKRSLWVECCNGWLDGWMVVKIATEMERLAKIISFNRHSPSATFFY